MRDSGFSSRGACPEPFCWALLALHLVACGRDQRAPHSDEQPTTESSKPDESSETPLEAGGASPHPPSPGAETHDDDLQSPFPPAFVLHVSVDGLRSDAIENLGARSLPSFYQLQSEGVFTHDARTDVDYTVTLPNHTSQLTGRPVLGETGHLWTTNFFESGSTLHAAKGSYVASVFDVLHDHGLRTAFFSGKSKFQLFLDSYDIEHGAIDRIGEDNGRAKIDFGLIEADQTRAVNSLISALEDGLYHYTFFHFHQPDSAGHSTGWNIQDGSAYSAAVMAVDMDLGRVLTAIKASPLLATRTTVFLTTDHGGTESAHSDPYVLSNFRIPFYAWGRSVERGNDLYQLNQGRRAHPGRSLLSTEQNLPPIRNADIANAACRQLGLPSIQGSTINVDALPLSFSQQP